MSATTFGAAAAPANAGARLDRLPFSRFHHRIMWLIGIGMFFDGFDIYIAATVLGATLKEGFSTIGQNALFVSMTFVGMMIGSFLTGFIGDRMGRRFIYQGNLALFGLASLASAFAPNMTVLIVCRFFMGVGLGAENVVGYSTLAEFVPPKLRGRQQGLMATFVVTGLPVSALLGLLLVPSFGWRTMFVIGGLGAMVVWWARKKMPESPRWLESSGRVAEADELLKTIEAEVAAEKGALPAPAAAPAIAPNSSFSALLNGPMYTRLFVGSVVLIVINTLLYGFVTWLPTFFVSQGLTVTKSFTFALIMALGAPIGTAIGAWSADHWGRKPTIIGSSLIAAIIGAIYPFITDATMIPLVGFLLVVPIYVLVALLFGIYVPELFPTGVRLRASGICNTFGRGATIGTPFLVVHLFQTYGVVGVLALMIALLVVQILVVAFLGIESSKRALEEVSSIDADGGGTSHGASLSKLST
jgi:putative MFS transporter